MYLNNTQVEDVNAFKNIIGYVLQEDLMEERMSPKELFDFYAKLRIDKNSKQTTEERKDDIDYRVEEMIEMMGL